MTSPPERPQLNDTDDPLGAAQQSPPEESTPQVQRQTKEETKELEPSQTVATTGGAAMNAPSVGAPPTVNQQSVDLSQATLQAVQQLSQQLREQEERLQQQLREQEERLGKQFLNSYEICDMRTEDNANSTCSCVLF